MVPIGRVGGRRDRAGSAPRGAPMPRTASPRTTTPRVGNLMTADPVVIDADASVHEAELLLKSYRISGLPVVTDGAVVGVISQTDLLNARSSQLMRDGRDRVN